MLDLDNISHYRIMALTPGHIATVEVTVYRCQQFVSRPLPFTGNLDGGDTSHDFCP